MLVIPAIDIKGGRCVRLFQGDFNKVTEYSDDPGALVAKFVREGAKALHLVDLDGAEAGSPVNGELILSIARHVDVPVQVGGGIQTYDVATWYLKSGVRRVILGTAAVENTAMLRRLIEEFGGDRVVVAADIKGGRLAIRGWTRQSSLSVKETITLLRSLGVRQVLVTDISKDGTLKGPNFGLAQKFIDAGLSTIASGGIAEVDDLVELNKRGAYGAVIGKALYEGRLEIAQSESAVAYVNDLSKRIIVCLDVKDGLVVKGTNFKALRIVGDPVEMARKYGLAGADELVFLDIAATSEGRKTLRRLVRNIAKTIDIPFTVGGGISSMDDVGNLLGAGADKVSIGTSAVSNPKLVNDVAGRFGSQSVVVSVDAKRRGDRWELYVMGGTRAVGMDVLEFCVEMQERGAGELMVNSLDRDGTSDGFDLELLSEISTRVNIPVIASSGGGRAKDYAAVFRIAGADAALGAGIFHYGRATPSSLKSYLARQGVEVRP